MTTLGTAYASDDNIVLRTWYVSEHRLPELLEASHRALWSRILAGSDPQYRKIQLANAFADPVISFIRRNSVPSLHSLIEDSRLACGGRFVFDGVLFSRGLSGRDRSTQVSLTSKKAQLPNEYQLKLSFSRNGLVTDTAYDAISGTKHLFVLGSIQNVKDTLIEAVPYLVGALARKPCNGLELPLYSSMEVQPGDVDQFSGIDFTMPVSKRDLNQLKAVPEKRVKEILCTLLGEAEVPKDWGGEECDLYTDHVRIKGCCIATAFLLKGPAKFHELTMADCGKNGDQIVRLFNTGADLLVVQHCHKITPGVRTHVRNFAIARMSFSCRYMFLDGYRTVNIMRHVGEIK